MAQAPHTTSVPRISKEDAEQFEALLREGWDKPWWRSYIDKVWLRRTQFVNELLEGTLTQREEDRLRGRVNELNWLLAIDAYGKTLHEERRNGS